MKTTDFGMTVKANEQEITFNFYDVVAIVKGDEIEDDSNGLVYFSVNISYISKGVSTVPMLEEDYNNLISKYNSYLQYCSEHPEMNQLRSINGIMGEEIGKVLKESIKVFMDAQQRVEDTTISTAENFQMEIAQQTQAFMNRCNEMAEKMDAKMQRINEIHDKLERIDSLVSGFLVEDSTNEKESVISDTAS